ncbi:VWA domain-containing protein [Bdellovibrionota bacterium]
MKAQVKIALLVAIVMTVALVSKVYAKAPTSSVSHYMDAALEKAESTINLNWRYQTAEDGSFRSQKSSVVIPEISLNQQFAVTDKGITKTIFLVNLANTMKKSLKDFSEACRDPFPSQPHPILLSKPVNPGVVHSIPTPILPNPYTDCTNEMKIVGDDLFGKIDSLNAELMQNSTLLSDENIVEMLDLARKLAKNMKETEEPVYYPMDGNVRMELAFAGGLNVTGGGAQDIDHFRKMVDDGYVPSSESLTVEGFLSEFDLSLESSGCDQLICMHPALAVDITDDTKKVYLQIGMNSNVSKETFERKPLNLSVVLDISGSMSATDNTEKSRIEWAKEVLTHTINQLNEGDVLSVVLFNQESELLFAPTDVTDKEALIKLVNSLEAGGSTNLEAGLRDGFELVSENLIAGYENRVILISDAGLNTGVTDQANLLRLVTDFADEGIGLTAIGLGLNFNQDFIHGITMSHGGNYIFVHSGKKMAKFFRSFNYLVTPVAYNLKARIDLNGLKAKLVNAYGVPSSENEPLRDIVNLKTLFFSEEGGGILLEYVLE